MTTASPSGGQWPRPFGLFGDERLAQRIGGGDDRAFAVVYERYHQMLYRYCRSILRDESDAQDALQSTFAAAFAALRAGQRDAPMRPWLFRIAHNESISVFRRRRPVSELSTASEQRATSIEDEVAGRAEFSVLLRDLRDLTDRQRSALVLRELSGLSHQEIAIALGTSVGAAKQTIFEARRSLFEFAEGRAMACDEIRRTISDADGRMLRSRRVRAHLRECVRCSAFAAAIPARSEELRALVPALPAAAGAGLIGHAAVAAVGRGGGAGLGPAAAGAAAKTAVVGAGFGANALAGVAVVATATAGVTVGVGKIAHALAQRDSVRSGTVPAAPAARPVRSLPATATWQAAHAGAARGHRTSSRVGANKSLGTVTHATSTPAAARSGASRAGSSAAGASGLSEASSQVSSPPSASGVAGSVYPWSGAPARIQSTEPSSADPARSQGSPGGQASEPAATGSVQEKPAPATSSNSDRAASTKPQRAESTGHAHRDGANGHVNGPASVSGTVGAVSSAAATVSGTAAGTVSTTTGTVGGTVGAAVGGVSSTVGGVSSTLGGVSSTVAGLVPSAPSGSQPAAPISLPGSITGILHRHRDSS